MPTMTIGGKWPGPREPTDGGRRPPHKRHPKARITTDDGLKFVVPFAPNEVTHEGLADTFAQLDRPGRRPLMVFTADGLRSCSFSLSLLRPDPQASIEADLKKLRQIAASGDRCTVSLSGLEDGVVWYLTALTITTSRRQYGTNDATRATASLTFTEAVDAVVHVGPVSGGKKKKHKKRHHGNGGKGGKGTDQHYTVRRGDTLAKIALRFYGDPNDWHRIAKASHVRDPRKLKVGQRLTIPADK